MLKNFVIQKLSTGAYPHIPPQHIMAINRKVEEHDELVIKRDRLWKAANQAELKRTNRELRIMLVVGVVIFFVIASLTDDFMSGFWAVLIAPIAMGLLMPSETSSERAEVNLVEKRLEALQKEIRDETYSVTSEERSIQDSIFKQNADYWLSMSGWQFEKEVAKLFERDGYKVTITKGSADGGVDLFLYKDGAKYAVQCKNHRRAVGPASVRDLYGAMRHERVKKGIFISSSGFTTGALEFSAGKALELLDISDIVRMHKSS